MSGRRVGSYWLLIRRLSSRRSTQKRGREDGIIVHHFKSQPIIVQNLNIKGEGCNLRAPFVLRTFPPRAAGNPHTRNTHHSLSDPITAHHSSNGMNPLLFPLEHQGGGMQSSRPLCPSDISPASGGKPAYPHPSQPIRPHHSPSLKITAHHSSKLEHQGGGMQSFAPPLSFGHFPRERRETRIPATPITVHHSTSQPIIVQTV